MMRIVIADSEARIETVLGVMAREFNVSVVAEVSQVEALLDNVMENAPDVVLLGWELPGFLPEIHLPALRYFGTNTKIIILSKDANTQLHAMAAGADCFVNRQDLLLRLPAAIHAVRPTGRRTITRYS